MKILKAYSSGFKAALNTKKLSATIYIITIMMALILAIPFGSTIEKEAGNSMAFTNLLKDFDYTVYKDFMDQSAKAIQPYIQAAIWMGVFYLIFTIFFEGGILTVLRRKEDKFSLRFFWEASAKYFSRFFRLAIYAMLFQLAAAVVVLGVLSKILSSASDTVQSEASLIYIGLIGIIIYILIFIFLLVVTDYAKVMLVENEEYRPFRTILRSFGFVFRHFLTAYFLYLFLLVVPILLFIIYFRVEDGIGMSSGGKIFIIFIIQQVFVWARIFIKIWTLGSELNLYRKFEKKEESAEGEPVFGI